MLKIANVSVAVILYTLCVAGIILGIVTDNTEYILVFGIVIVCDMIYSHITNNEERKVEHEERSEILANLIEQDDIIQENNLNLIRASRARDKMFYDNTKR